MKFLHAADIHLDSPLVGLAARADLPGDLVRGATRRAFTAMIDLAIAEDVAFVVIAGDLYDGDWRDFSTGLFFAAEMRRLARPCFLLRGNHDARSEITRHLALPPNVIEFSSRTCDTHTLPDLGVALHGHSFPNRAVPEDLSARYRDPVRGLLNIGVLHTSAEDSEEGGHDTYAPCRVNDLVAKGYAYWALGHVHQRRVLHERPWVVFPGNLQGRHARETGAKGCTLVTVEDRQVVAVEHRDLDVLRWAALTVDATGADATTLDALVAAGVRDAVGAAPGKPLLARLTLTGATSLHGRLLGETERLAAECRNAALAADADLWIEAVKLRTRPPVARDDEALAVLRAAFLGGLEDPAVAPPLLAEIDRLRLALPADIRAELDLPEGSEGLAALAEDAWAIVAAAMAEEPPA